jgi:hypothetical protein
MEERAGMNDLASYKIALTSPYEEEYWEYCCVFHAK